jgi:hypothetical protein
MRDKRSGSIIYRGKEREEMRGGRRGKKGYVGRRKGKDVGVNERADKRMRKGERRNLQRNIGRKKEERKRGFKHELCSYGADKGWKKEINMMEQNG